MKSCWTRKENTMKLSEVRNFLESEYPRPIPTKEPCALCGKELTDSRTVIGTGTSPSGAHLECWVREHGTIVLAGKLVEVELD
jgi:hypothetical protein